MAPTIRRLFAFFFLLQTASFAAASEQTTDLELHANNKVIAGVEQLSRENRSLKPTTDSDDDVVCLHCNSLREVSRVNQLIFTVNLQNE